MINRQEVMELAREFGLAAQVVEKDYVLGWMLAGIGAHPVIGQSWVFKGGTCLKKCYFETYRFSEDLDFTLTDPAQLEEPFLRKTFVEIAAWIYEQSGIQVPADTLRFDIYTNPRGNPSVQGRVSYHGPFGRSGDAPRIKLDLTNDEVLVLEPELRQVHHPYSDRPVDGINVRCYAFEEVFAEKIRALAERERPRDLYDVVHLYRRDELRPDRTLVLDALRQKCSFKGIPIPTMNTVENPAARAELEADWGNMLAHQLPDLPSFAQFWQELPAVFDWLHGRREKFARPAIKPVNIKPGEINTAWRPPAMSHAWGAAVPLEIIRFAAANRLCVSLRYDGTSRVIEPYSLLRTKDDKLILNAVRHDNGEQRSYRVDRIEGAEVAKVSFTPRFAIELTSAGPLSVPPSTSRSTFGMARRSLDGRPTQAKSMSSTKTGGPTYVYKCGICKKTFSRKSMSATLNPHKAKNGYPCPGRHGVYIKTAY